MKKATLTIKGMHCASCATNIERSLSKIKGVKNARVALLMNKGYVECEDAVKEEELKNAVKKTGYQVIAIDYEKA